MRFFTLFIEKIALRPLEKIRDNLLTFDKVTFAFNKYLVLGYWLFLSSLYQQFSKMLPQAYLLKTFARFDLFWKNPLLYALCAPYYVLKTTVMSFLFLQKLLIITLLKTTRIPLIFLFSSLFVVAMKYCYHRLLSRQEKRVEYERYLLKIQSVLKYFCQDSFERVIIIALSSFFGGQSAFFCACVFFIPSALAGLLKTCSESLKSYGRELDRLLEQQISLLYRSFCSQSPHAIEPILREEVVDEVTTGSIRQGAFAASEVLQAFPESSALLLSEQRKRSQTRQESIRPYDY